MPNLPLPREESVDAAVLSFLATWFFSPRVILERQELTSIEWNYQVVLLFLAFAVCLFCLYSFFPVVIKWSSALVVNLSILTADFYSLVVGIFVFKFAVSRNQFFSEAAHPAQVLTMLFLITFDN